jgi:acetyltransferase-like isoleucine patch superfamily enzyme
MAAAHRRDFRRMVSTLAALVRAQIFLFPRLNSTQLRIYGRVRIRGRKANLHLGRRVVFLGDAEIVCGWDAYDDVIRLEDGVVIEHGCYLNAHGGRIEIAHGAFLGVGSVIQGKGTVRIGVQTLLGPGVKVFSSDHPTDPGATPRQALQEICAPVHIGDQVWIGADSTILKGSTIDAGSVVAAGSVVKHGGGAGAQLLASRAVLASPVRRIGEGS